MISFDVEAGHVNYRVAGVCLHARYVLLQRAVAEDFWALPGARGRRDVWSPALGAGEFFTYAGRDYHELAFYYVMPLPASSSLLDVQREYAGIEPDNPLEFRWFLVDRLAAVRLYPTILRTALRELPATAQHLIHTDEPDEPSAGCAP